MKMATDEWIKRPSGGYSRKSDEEQFKLVIQNNFEKIYLYSCYLYYEEDDPVLEDSYFDMIQNMLEKDFHLCTPSFQSRAVKGSLKTTAFELAKKLTSEEIVAAKEWKLKNDTLAKKAVSKDTIEPENSV